MGRRSTPCCHLISDTKTYLLRLTLRAAARAPPRAPRGPLPAHRFDQCAVVSSRLRAPKAAGRAPAHGARGIAADQTARAPAAPPTREGSPPTPSAQAGPPRRRHAAASPAARLHGPRGVCTALAPPSPRYRNRCHATACMHTRALQGRAAHRSSRMGRPRAVSLVALIRAGSAPRARGSARERVPLQGEMPLASIPSSLLFSSKDM